MELSNQARLVSIYVTEKERYHGRPLYTAVAEYLHKHGATGTTTFRAVEGFGVHQQIHTARIEMLMYDLPILIQWIDSEAQIERLLPDVSAMVSEGLITIQPVTVVKHAIRDLRPISGSLTVADVMTHDPATVRPETPLSQVVELLVWRLYRSLPVVDDDQHVVGIVTNSDLVARGGLSLRTELLHTLETGALQSELARLNERGGSAKDVMTQHVVTVNTQASLNEAAHTMAMRALKRFPVVDENQRLVGIISRVDVLRTLALHPVSETENSAAMAEVTLESPVANIMNRQAPSVRANASLSDVLESVVSTRLNRTVVVDEEKRPLGVITDAELMRRLDPQQRSSIINVLMRHIPFVGLSAEERETLHFLSGTRAGDLMISPALSVTQSTSVAEAARRMLERRYKILPVVDENGRLVGIIDRSDLLRSVTAR